MNQTKHLKGECQHCGGHIEFPADAIGQSVDCPHCARPTELTLAAPPDDVDEPGRSRKWRVVGVVILAVGVVVTVASVVVLKKLAWRHQQQVFDMPAEPPAPLAVSNADPFIRSNHFTVSKVSLEKSKGSTVIYATGQVENESPRQRFGVKITLDLFDGAGARLGTASDYQPVLEAKAEWRFKALVIDSKTVSAKLASIDEDQ